MQNFAISLSSRDVSRKRPWFGTMHLVLLALALPLVSTLIPLPALGQAIKQAKIIEILDSDQVFIQNAKARKNAIARLGQQVRTGQARAGLNFNNRATVRLGRNSSLIVGSQCVRLNSGRIAISGTRGCIGSVVAVTRGTIYTLEVMETGQGQVIVLEGEIELSNLEIPDTPPVVVRPAQKVAIGPNGEIGTVEPLSLQELENIRKGQLFEGYKSPIDSSSDRGFRSTFLQDALGGGDSNFEGVEPVVAAPTVIPGIFTRTGGSTAIFTPADGSPSVPISVDFDTGAISIDGTSGIANSVGLSGNNASGTVILEDGRAVRVRVFSIGGEEPPIGRSFRGSLSTGIEPDR